ncbi:uncharacterized protein A4U43_C01F31650 [Asparagus officinalis]|uniref:Uncharacterized protein n=1 Tax=Asparagus officinalis TaxID=4686 RepID=A0A5P1FVW0_ASPOF|nr:uncharacterized protein A4U43_C01F31650 [Asparagus officinalis]
MSPCSQIHLSCHGCSPPLDPASASDSSRPPPPCELHPNASTFPACLRQQPPLEARPSLPSAEPSLQPLKIRNPSEPPSPFTTLSAAPELQPCRPTLAALVAPASCKPPTSGTLTPNVGSEPPPSPATPVESPVSSDFVIASVAVPASPHSQRSLIA